MAHAETDQNLLFGLIAMQSDLIDMRQFVDACTLWGSRKESSLADILVGQGWLLADDKKHVDYLLQRRLQKAGGDVKKSLAGMPGAVRDVLGSLEEGDLRASLSATLGPKGIMPTVQISEGGQAQERITRRGLHSTGGIGHVWLAHDKTLNRSIAVYGTIRVRTDGNKVVLAQKLEKPRSKSMKWDIYRLERKGNGPLLYQSKH